MTNSSSQRTRVALCWAFAVQLIAASMFAQSIFTIAGGGTDDGRPATAAAVYQPFGVSVDRFGNVYIADTEHHRVRKVSAATGLMSTIAGTGGLGFSGDEGPAIKASLNRPTTVAVDDAGNVFIADSGNHRVRKVEAESGIITTFAGIGLGPGPSNGVPAISASIPTPHGIALDRHANLFITQLFGIVSKVDALTGIISTVAGALGSGFSGDGGSSLDARFDRPEYVAIDASDNVYIADTDNHRVRRIDARTGIISTVAGNGAAGFTGDGGPASAAALGEPRGIAVDAAGNLYIADTTNARIRRVAASTGVIITVAGTGHDGFAGDGRLASAADLSYPTGVALGLTGDIYIADRYNNRIRRVEAVTGLISTFAGTGTASFVGDGGAATAAALVQPEGVAIDRSGALYVADCFNHRIRKVDPKSGLISTFAGNGNAGYSGDGGPATAAELYCPVAIAFGAGSDLYVAANSSIRRIIAATGTISTVISGVNPGGLAIDGAGNLFFTDKNKVQKVELPSGRITTIAGTGTYGFSGDGGLAASATLANPQGIACDARGNIYFADSDNHRIRFVDALTGSISTVAGNGGVGGSGDGGPATAAGLYRPFGVSVDSSGNLLFADWTNKVRKVAAGSGIITKIAGHGDMSLWGDGGPASDAALSRPGGVGTDPLGNIYIADTGNNRIRVVYACRTPGAPLSISPLAGDRNVNTPVMLIWSAAEGAFRYDVFLDTTNPPQKIVASDISALRYTSANLESNATYYWKIVAKGDSYCPAASTAASEIRSFTTALACGPPPQLDLDAPPNGAVIGTVSVQLSWKSVSGASSYDVYLGTSDPPAFAASNLATTVYTAATLAPNATYSWYVVAHAACDPAKTTRSLTFTFQTTGTCTSPGVFTLRAPANGATGVQVVTTLDWSSSATASGYDVYFGAISPPPLYARDISTPRMTVTGLAASRTYYWRVVAKVACDGSKNVSTGTNSFTTAATCAVPSGSSITFVPPGNVGVGQTYSVAWQEVPELDIDGYYIIERSTSLSFAAILDAQQIFSTSASFIAPSAGAYYHRVRAVAACDPSRPGPVSDAKMVNVITGTANVVFTVQPQAVITALGDKLEDQKARFTLENIGTSSLQVIIGKGEINSAPFFTIRDPLGGDSVFATLAPRTPKSFEISFSGPSNQKTATYQGIIFVAATGQGLAITPYAFVNLKVGGGATAKPSFTTNSNPTEYAFFPGFAGEDGSRPPITVMIRNDGTESMELGAEIGPEVWLLPEAGWNATPIPPGASRPVHLRTVRSRAPNGSALPRYTYFTIRSRNGQSARLLVQDNDAVSSSAGRQSLLAPGSRSYIVPAAITSTADAAPITRLRLTNVGSEAIQSDLFFTPEGADGFNAALVRRATVVVPANDVVALTDPLQQVFGLTSAGRGQIEVRAAPERIGFITVSATVVSRNSGGGEFIWQLPVVRLGEGARVGASHVVNGITFGSGSRCSVTLAEVSGSDSVLATARLLDSQGNVLASSTVLVPRYGQRTLDSASLGFPDTMSGGRLSISADDGGGSVVAVVTLLDRDSNTGATLVSEPVYSTVAPSASGLRLGVKADSGTSNVVAPLAVNGSATGTSMKFRTSMGFSLVGTVQNSATVTFRPSDPSLAAMDRVIKLLPNVSIHFDNILEQLFGVPSGSIASGALLINAPGGAAVYAQLQRLAPGAAWRISGAVPVYASKSEVLTSLMSQRPLYLDGLEQSIDESRGTRWDVILTESTGKSGSATIRLYEAGNRSQAIAERSFTLRAYEQLTLRSVFSALGLDSDERRKDRTNVLCVVTASGGGAIFAATAVATDNVTGDTHIYVFSPSGGVPATGVSRVSLVNSAPAAPTAGGTRRRAVKH